MERQLKARAAWTSASVLGVAGLGYGIFRWIRRRGSAARSADAVELLRQEHEKVRDLFERFEKVANPVERQSIARETLETLNIHNALEEELFMPALRRVLNNDSEINRALAQHQQENPLIAELQTLEAGDPPFEAKYQALTQVVRAHFRDEEAGLLAAAEKADIHARRLGTRMAWRRKELKSKLLRPERVV